MTPNKHSLPRTAAAAVFAALLPQISAAATTTVIFDDLVPVDTYSLAYTLAENAGGGYGGVYYHWATERNRFLLPAVDAQHGALTKATLVLSTSLSAWVYSDPHLTGNQVAWGFNITTSATDTDNDHASDLLDHSTYHYLQPNESALRTWYIDVLPGVAAGPDYLVSTFFQAVITYAGNYSAHMSIGVSARAEYEYVTPAPIPLPGTLPLVAGGVLTLAAFRRRKA